ncbi:HAD family hydrolase [Sphingobacterium humi]|uniref:HAD-IB family hydrolase n=1 Tax=Sphingobacterium humi TaxID=1796905 RepID=A0A6N8KW19_9SPHI|nr:HAD family hydrolase [Sphingobacterium humi]MVZ60994.1 HAD-IB family hydrolase [Sphingobacterium humi]
MDKINLELFDFDGTLTDKDTFVDIIKFNEGFFKCYIGFLRYAPFLVLMKLNLYSNQKTKEMIFSYFFKGMHHAAFNALCKAYTEDRFPKIIRTKAIDYIKDSKAQKGIVSASMFPWVKLFAEKLGIDFVLATEVEIDENGLLTGKFASANCHGEEKVNRINKKLTARDSYAITAFGDSSGDKQMLAYADRGFFNYFK